MFESLEWVTGCGHLAAVETWASRESRRISNMHSQGRCNFRKSSSDNDESFGT
jgi:hypothetical protein